MATTGPRAQFVRRVGRNVDPAWERATGLYRVGATNEGGHYAVKTAPDGRRVWEVAWLKGHELCGWVDPATPASHTTPVPTDYAPVRGTTR